MNAALEAAERWDALAPEADEQWWPCIEEGRGG
jgi:hypothetical protein